MIHPDVFKTRINRSIAQRVAVDKRVEAYLDEANKEASRLEGLISLSVEALDALEMGESIRSQRLLHLCRTGK